MSESGKKKSAGALAYERGEYQEALAYFSDKLASGRAKRPESTWFWIGACNFGLGRFDEAIEAFEMAQELGNDRPELMEWWVKAMMQVGYRHYDEEDYSLALGYLEAALEMDDGRTAAELWFSIGTCHYNLRSFREACDALSSSLLLNPNDEVAMDWWQCAQKAWSQSLYKERRYQEALEGFCMVAERASLDPSALAGVKAWIGACYQRMEQYHQAIRAFEEAGRLVPEHEAFRASLAYLLALAPVDELRDGKRAVQLATELCQQSDPPKWEHMTLIAAAEAEVGNFAVAVPLYERAMAMMPEEERAKRADSIEQLRQGKPLRCSAAFDHARSPSGVSER